MPRPFVLLDTSGAPQALSEQRGRPLLAAFFKVTCPTCMLAFPYLERLYQTYGPHGLTVWGISQDTLDDSLAFAREQGVTFPILLDTTWDVSTNYAIEHVPTTLLFGRAGKVICTAVAFAKDDLNEIARMVVLETGSEPAIIAPAGDGKPAFRPG